MTGSVFLSPSLAMTQFVLFIPMGPDSAESQPPTTTIRSACPLSGLAGVFCGFPGVQAGHYKLDLWHFPKCPNFCLYRTSHPMA